MKVGSTLFLKVAVFLMGVPVLVLCMFLLPQLLIEAINEAKNDSQLAYVVFAILFVLYASAIPFYFALFQAFKLLNYIDKNIAFSQSSIVALSKIRNCAIVISCLFVIALPFVFVIAEWDDAPGLAVVGMMPIFASMVIAVFAAVLQRLLKDVINIKEENDLMV